MQSVVILNIFVTCCKSPIKVQNMCVTTNFFMNYSYPELGYYLHYLLNVKTV